MQIFRRHLTLGSDDAPTITNSDLSFYTTGDNNDVIHSVSGGVLTVDGASALTDEELFTSSTTTFTPGGNVNTHDLENNGTITAGSNTFTVDGSWDNNGTFNGDTSTVTFTGTSETISHNSGTFNNLTIDPATAATTTLQDTSITVVGTLNVAVGDTLSLNTGLALTAQGTITLNGTIDGAGTLTITDTSSGPGTTGTLSSITRYDATSANIPSTTLDTRTYSGLVEIYSNQTSARTATLAAGTYNFNNGLNLLAANSANMTLTGTTNNSSVNISGGNLDFTGGGGGSEVIQTGTGW